MLRNRWCSGKNIVVLPYVVCLCKPSQSLSFLFLTSVLSCLARINTDYKILEHYWSPPVRCVPGWDVWASLLILVSVNTAWSEVTIPLFCFSWHISRKENTKLCFSQESCSPLFLGPEFCQWHKLMLSQDLSSRFSSGVLEAKLSFILVA